MVAINGIGADEATVFEDEQKQETINDAKQLAVKLRGRELFGIEFLAEFVVVLVREETVAQKFETFLDAVAQMFAHAPALLNGLRVVFFQQTFAGVGHAAWQAGARMKPVERGEVLKALFLENRPEDQIRCKPAGERARNRGATGA